MLWLSLFYFSISLSPGHCQETNERVSRDNLPFQEFKRNQENIGKKLSRKRRIVGEDKADWEEHPWAVQFQFTLSNGTNVTFCFGTLLKNSWILTAAHCTNGIRERNKISATLLDQKRRSLGLILTHPNWRNTRNGRFSYDVAMVKLTGDSYYGTPASLPNGNFKINIQVLC